MATLDFAKRWFPFTPAWLDNRTGDAPFKVKIRRLTIAELDAFREAAAGVTGKQTTTTEELCGLFSGIVEGPIGALDINETEVVDLAGLMAFAAQECPMLEGSLVVELVGVVIGLNVLSKDAAGN